MTIDLGDDVAERCVKLYAKGLPSGDSMGWRPLDQHYTVASKQWTPLPATI